ncbi:MAG: cytochrome c [Planctomycetota bacterium]|nr:MAG: cytochrome c [Planctomycetota bacterium]
MRDTGRLKPLEGSSVFADGRSARPPVPGTVAREHLRGDAAFHTGKRDGQFLAEIPFPVTRADLERGRERFNIYCSPCHDRTGSGRGMIVQRGFKQPPSYHDQRLREAPVGYFFDVMTAGFGVMYSFASRIPAEDRWKIAAYLRVLQYSQHAPLSAVADPALLEGR